MLGLLDSFTEAQSHRPPAPGARTVAEHTAHLWYSLDLFLKRVRGEDPKAEWETSFDLRGRDWATLKSDLRRAYEACLEVLTGNRDKPIDQWPPIHIAGPERDDGAQRVSPWRHPPDRPRDGGAVAGPEEPQISRIGTD